MLGVGIVVEGLLKEAVGVLDPLAWHVLFLSRSRTGLQDLKLRRRRTGGSRNKPDKGEETMWDATFAQVDGACEAEVQGQEAKRALADAAFGITNTTMALEMSIVVNIKP